MNEFTIKRITLYMIILFLGIVLVWQLYYFIPGFLLAITLYILMRKSYFDLTDKRRVNRTFAALTMIFLGLIILAVPIWVVIQILIPKISYVATNSGDLLKKVVLIVGEIQQRFPQVQIDQHQVQQVLRNVIVYVPGVFGTTAAILANFATAFFVVFFMLKAGRSMEAKLVTMLPLKPANKESIWNETKNLIISNAIGIPLLAICQAIIAIAGYWIFGVPDFVIWGIITGICSLIPIIGTMIVWIPLVIYLFAIGSTAPAIGLAIYSAVIISNVDNVLRFTMMRKLGDVHPLVTVFGVIVGLQLFGFIGLIFGPLFISYFILMIKIYRVEFYTGTAVSSPSAGDPTGNKNL